MQGLASDERCGAPESRPERACAARRDQTLEFTREGEYASLVRCSQCVLLVGEVRHGNQTPHSRRLRHRVVARAE